MKKARLFRPTAWLTAALTAALPSISAAQVVEYYSLDAVGSVRAVADQAGAVIERHDFYAYGEECTAPPCGTQPGTNTKKFTGKERDTETGLDYFGARYYGSKIGRFTTIDPAMTIDKNVTLPQRWNRYAYALNNPQKFVDPDGRDVSLAITFVGSLSAQDKSGVLARVDAWYSAQGVGNVYVFDAAAKEHGAWFASVRRAYTGINVSSESSRKQDYMTVYAGNYADLPENERLNAIANAVVHETAAHHFFATYGADLLGGDQLSYLRGSMGSQDPQIRARYGTVADSYAQEDPRFKSKVVKGPIPIHPDDRRKLIERVGPGVHANPPVER